MNIGEAVIAAVAPHPDVARIELVGSRAKGCATEWSDWDLAVWTSDFSAVFAALPELLAPLEPLFQQWDRLADEYCWMLLLAGPLKVDLIFPDEPHAKEPPWTPEPGNIAGIDGHFWDWVWWLRGKEAAGKSELVTVELGRLFEHLLGPLGVEGPPLSLGEAVSSYRAGRNRVERRFGVAVARDVELAVAPALADGP